MSLTKNLTSSLVTNLTSSLIPNAPAPASPLIPNTIEGLQLFLKIKNDPAYITFDGTFPTQVSDILDLSGNNRHFQQVSTSSQAVFQASSDFNSKEGLLFSNDSYTCLESGFVSSLAATTAFFVIRPGTIEANGYFYQEPAGAGLESYYSYGSVGYSFRISRFDSVTSYSTTISNTSRILRITDGPSLRNLYDYGVQIGSDSGGGSTVGASDNAIIGKRNTGNPFAGSIHEILIYNRVLTAGEITTIEDYLITEWGVA